MVIEENDVWKSCNCFVKVIAKDPSSESGNMEVETETLYCDPKYFVVHFFHFNSPEFTRVITLSSRVADFVRFEVYHKTKMENKNISFYYMYLSIWFLHYTSINGLVNMKLSSILF